MSVAYRTVASGPTETIVIRAPPRWYALVMAVPYLLTFNRAFMDFIAPMPSIADGGFCGNGSKNFYAFLAAQSWAAEVRGILFMIALVAAIFALTAPFFGKTVVVVDRSARVIRVKAKAGRWSVAFGERPVLVHRDRAWFLHAGALTPIRLGPNGVSQRAIDRLRAALAALG